MFSPTLLGDFKLSFGRFQNRNPNGILARRKAGQHHRTQHAATAGDQSRRRAGDQRIQTRIRAATAIFGNQNDLEASTNVAFDADFTQVEGSPQPPLRRRHFLLHLRKPYQRHSYEQCQRSFRIHRAVDTVRSTERQLLSASELGPQSQCGLQRHLRSQWFSDGRTSCSGCRATATSTGTTPCLTTSRSGICISRMTGRSSIV